MTFLGYLAQWTALVLFNDALFMTGFLLHQGKGKAIPLEVWTRPEDSRRLKLSDFKTIGA
jgi:hypothetical protein